MGKHELGVLMNWQKLKYYFIKKMYGLNFKLPSHAPSCRLFNLSRRLATVVVSEPNTDGCSQEVGKRELGVLMNCRKLKCVSSRKCTGLKLNLPPQAPSCRLFNPSRFLATVVYSFSVTIIDVRNWSCSGNFKWEKAFHKSNLEAPF